MQNLEQCKVCGENESQYVYYGGRSCTSCRQFFRRSVVQFSKSPRSCYICICDEKCSEKGLILCTLDKSTRYRCKHCRYKKCLDLTGMRPQWVIQQYIPKVENEKNREDAASIFTGSGVIDYRSKVQETNPGTVLSLSLNKKLNNSGEDRLNIVKVIVMNHNTHYRSISFGEKIMKGFIFVTLFGGPVSIKNRTSVHRILFEKNITAALHFPDFMDLSAKLQTTLLKHNASMLVALCRSLPDQVTDQLSPNDVDIVKSETGMEKSFNNVTHENRTHLLNFNDINVKERHRILDSRVQAKLMYDPNLWKILFYILLFCSDFHDECIDIEERHLIEKTQEKLVLLLQNYMYARISPNVAAVGFANVMESLLELRELSDITNNLQI